MSNPTQSAVDAACAEIKALHDEDEEREKQKHRMTLELTPNQRARLDRLQDRTDAASRAEVIRTALVVYELQLDSQERER